VLINFRVFFSSGGASDLYLLRFTLDEVVRVIDAPSSFLCCSLVCARMDAPIRLPPLVLAYISSGDKNIRIPGPRIRRVFLLT